MNKYEVTLSANYEKNISVYAATPAHAREKVETILFDTDLIDFTDEDFVSGEVVIDDPCEDDFDEDDDLLESDFGEDCCFGCAYFCPICGECVYEDEM